MKKKIIVTILMSLACLFLAEGQAPAEGGLDIEVVSPYRMTVPVEAPIPVFLVDKNTVQNWYYGWATAEGHLVTVKIKEGFNKDGDKAEFTATVVLSGEKSRLNATQFLETMRDINRQQSVTKAMFDVKSADIGKAYFDAFNRLFSSHGRDDPFDAVVVPAEQVSKMAYNR